MRTFSVVIAVLLAVTWNLPAPTRAEEVVFQSRPGARVSLLELYTSEGCSSCPPAETWLSRLQGDPRLWTEFVPVAFHVDYWDNLGWKDRFSAGTFTSRQREYGVRWGGQTIYTPEFVLDGREWRGLGEPPALGRGGDPGALSARVKGGNGPTVSVSFAPAAQSQTVREAFVALLGFDLRSSVKAGENRGRALSHDFVALGWERRTMAVGASGRQEATLRLPEAPRDAGRLALAVWVAPANGGGPEQAVGGWLGNAGTTGTAAR